MEDTLPHALYERYSNTDQKKHLSCRDISILFHLLQHLYSTRKYWNKRVHWHDRLEQKFFCKTSLRLNMRHSTRTFVTWLRHRSFLRRIQHRAILLQRFRVAWTKNAFKLVKQNRIVAIFVSNRIYTLPIQQSSQKMPERVDRNKRFKATRFPSERDDEGVEIPL